MATPDPNTIYKGAFGFIINITIGKPLDSNSTYKFLLKRPNAKVPHTTYTFDPANDYVDIQAGKLAYPVKDGDFPEKGTYRIQIAEERDNGATRLLSDVITVPVNDSLIDE